MIFLFIKKEWTYESSLSHRILWYILVVCFLALIASEIYTHFLNISYSREYIDAKFRPITEKYDVTIVYEVDDDFFSPPERSLIPAGPSQHSIVKPIKHRVLLKYPPVLIKAFEKYPINVIKDHLNGINFAAEINEEGFYYAGSYDPFRKIIFLVDDGSNDNHLIEQIFHHEFSSLLLKGHSLWLNPWFDQNPKGFVYLYENMTDQEVLDLKTSLEGTNIDYEKGFMNTYGQTKFENDFNEYSTMIFTDPQKFKEIMARYPRVRGKFQVWLKFHQEIDPIFTEAYLFGKDP